MTQQRTWSAGDPAWTLGDRLGKALEHAGVSMGDMADFLECSRNTVSNYVHGHTKVPGAVLKLWAIRTGVRLEWLRSGDNPPTSPPPDADFRNPFDPLTVPAAA